MIQLHWKTVWQVFIKLNIQLPRDPAIALLVMYPPEMMTHVHTKTFADVFTEAFFITAKKMEAAQMSFNG